MKHMNHGEIKNRLYWKIGLAAVACLGIVIVATDSCFAENVVQLEQAPVNPEFVHHLASNETITRLLESDDHSFGEIPSPVDLSHLKGRSVISARLLEAAPAAYDLRLTGKLTPIKDQGNCGSCWAFATYGSLESNILPAETWDFSENNLNNRHGFDYLRCAGGNVWMSMAYLGRWSGPVNEADDPYNVSSDTSPSGLQPRKHVQEVLFLPGRASSTANEGIKTAVMNYGAIYTGMYYTSASYSAANHSYYYNGSSGSNHGVEIIGWDDNYSLNNFNTPAPGNGAFIVRNSWGTSWGENGYFYISYYDSRIGSQNTVFVNAESTTNYNHVYQYDPLGWVSSYGYGNTTAWGANIFTASSNENLAAVGFYTVDVNTSYEIRIYKNATGGPVSGVLSGSKEGGFAYAGYHTVVLDSLVPLNSAEKFSVVVRLTTSGYTWPIPVEQAFSGYSSSASSNSGESYMSNDGTNWWDLTTNGNVCLKAFTTLETTKNDFNSDGHPDILWRNTSPTGPYSGVNTVWFMGGTNGTTYTGQGWISPVADLTWEIAGIADFNSDGHPDILWRNTSPTGPYSGMNTVWFMGGTNGTTYTGQGWISPVADLTWEIAGIADFNSDGHPDILWRNTSPTGPYSGVNTVWFMGGTNGTTYTGQGWISPVADLTWEIAGIADFNSDGHPDILWRNTSPTGPYSGMNTVWFMGGTNGTTYTGQGWISPVADLTWEIAGIADFNSDGHPDILWRNTSPTGPYSGMNTVWFMGGTNGTTYTGQGWISPVADLTWEIAGQ